MNFMQSTSMFLIIPTIVKLGFVIVFGIIIFRIINLLIQKTKSIETYYAVVVSKRNHVWGKNSSTTYYATFEIEGQNRIELRIPSNKIGYISENDKGTLSYQGSLFSDFARD